MRPLKLTMQAFGPYAGKETIDFTTLGNRTMFVISGKTGSGKTTIFDGISYAIYGHASGEDRNGADLRSQFAENELATELSLEFSLRGKTYLVKRSPQQEKKRARGEGTTTIGAQAQLLVYGEDGKQILLAANVRDVNEKIKELMIIDSNQFRQILMIPQGEFRKLLTSDSKDKEAILQRLFHTHAYKRIEERLREDAKSLEKLILNQLDARMLVIKKIQAVYTRELMELIDAGSTNDLVIVPLLIEEIQTMTEEIDHLTVQLEQTNQLRESEQKKLYEAQTLLNEFSAMEQAKVQVLKLEEQQNHYQDLKQQVERGKKALLLVQQEQLCTRLSEEMKRYQSSGDALLIRVKQTEERVSTSEKQLSVIKENEGERKQIEESILNLQSIEKDVFSLHELEKKVTQITDQLEQEEKNKATADITIVNTEESLKQWNAKKQALETNRRLYLENETSVAKLARELEMFASVCKYVKQKDDQTTTLQQKQQRFADLTNRYQDMKETVSYLENQWMHSQAYQLSKRLTDDEPCPVCGSNTHPLPASLSQDAPSEQELTAAKRQLEDADQLRRLAESEVFKQQAIVDKEQELLTSTLEVIQHIDPSFTLEQLEAKQSHTSQKHHQLLLKQKELELEWSEYDETLTRLEQLEGDRTSLTQQLQQMSEMIQETKIRLATEQATLAQMKERIPVTLRNVNVYRHTLTELQDKHAKMIREMELAQKNLADAQIQLSNLTGQLENILAQKKDKEEELSVEREIFRNQLVEQGFASYQEYAQAKKSESSIKNLEDEISHYRESLRSARDRFAELEVKLAQVNPPNLAEIEQVIMTLTEQFNTLDEQKNAIIYKKRENEQIHQSIEEYNRAVKENEEKYKIIGNLADMAKGNNTLRISFERYVLASFLDDILEEANKRLLKMTSGRYQLQRKKDRSKGSAQSGLELLVLDAYTGGERHVKTLSGGESFKAALALALGLADIVQQYAGGVSLETMFIDEGFGTLDPESLDQAIEALIDIQSSGRLVGIISHVPELKERIDARLEVSASQAGSTTTFMIMN